MRLGRALVAAAAATVIVGMAVSSAAPGFADNAVPSPAPANVTVLIPGTNAPDSTASSSNTTSGSSHGGSPSSTGAGTELPTDAFGAPIPPAEPTKNASGLLVDHESLSVKEWLIVTGTGYTPGENVQFVLYPGAIVIGSVVADADGSAKARFHIPDGMRLGAHTVEATGWVSKHVANVEFTVVSVTAAAVLQSTWWLIVVLGALLAGLIATAIYFWHTIVRWFGGGFRPAETLP